jgi:ATP-dependent DNA helicase RecQ
LAKDGKVQLIQNIDRKLPLEDIAKSQGKTFDNILDEIESIVNSGTRVNINYYINTLLDSDNQEEIFDYFKSSNTDAIETAIRKLQEDDISEEEVLLTRIKFISDIAN